MPATLSRKPLLGVAAATALLLLVPAVAMQFTTEVNWSPGDFLVAAALLCGAGAAIVLGLGHVHGAGQRVALGLAVVLGLALVWAELAVGLFR
ncbi:MAG: hypothetical protein K8R60_02835 [Burkholderiales bacterium]|nr:hypothetical protein [Burkholderiales bacterium]